MAGAQDNTKSDPKELKKAEALWGNFMEYSKWSIVAIVILLAILGIALIDWA